MKIVMRLIVQYIEKFGASLLTEFKYLHFSVILHYCSYLFYYQAITCSVGYL